MQKLRFLSLAVSCAMVAMLDAKKVTKDFLESEIAETKYTRISPRTTHCLITTHSGMEFTGESTVADESNFDEELGKQYAYQQAFESMYEPYGFLLRYITQNKAQSEDEVSELEDSIKYMTNCASLEDLTILLEDGLDDETQAQKAVAIVKDYFKDEADTLVHFGNA